MKPGKIFVSFILLLMGIGTFLNGQEKVMGPPKFSAGVLTGYNRGYGTQANLKLHNTTNGEPAGDLKAISDWG